LFSVCECKITYNISTCTLPVMLLSLLLCTHFIVLSVRAISFLKYYPIASPAGCKVAFVLQEERAMLGYVVTS
jgi:hypothetical protein